MGVDRFLVKANGNSSNSKASRTFCTIALTRLGLLRSDTIFNRARSAVCFSVNVTCLATRGRGTRVRPFRGRGVVFIRLRLWSYCMFGAESMHTAHRPAYKFAPF